MISLSVGVPAGREPRRVRRDLQLLDVGNVRLPIARPAPAPPPAAASTPAAAPARDSPARSVVGYFAQHLPARASAHPPARACRESSASWITRSRSRKSASLRRTRRLLVDLVDVAAEHRLAARRELRWAISGDGDAASRPVAPCRKIRADVGRKHLVLPLVGRHLLQRPPRGERHEAIRDRRAAAPGRRPALVRSPRCAIDSQASAADPRVRIAQQRRQRLRERRIVLRAHQPRHARPHRRIAVARQCRPAIRPSAAGRRTSAGRSPAADRCRFARGSVSTRSSSVAHWSPRLRLHERDPPPRPIALELRLPQRLLNALAQFERFGRHGARPVECDRCRHRCRGRRCEKYSAPSGPTARSVTFSGRPLRNVEILAV